MEVVSKFYRDDYLPYVVYFLEFHNMYLYRTILAGEAMVHNYTKVTIGVAVAGKPGSHIGRAKSGCIEDVSERTKSYIGS